MRVGDPGRSEDERQGTQRECHRQAQPLPTICAFAWGNICHASYYQFFGLLGPGIWFGESNCRVRKLLRLHNTAVAAADGWPGSVEGMLWIRKLRGQFFIDLDSPAWLITGPQHAVAQFRATGEDIQRR